MKKSDFKKHIPKYLERYDEFLNRVKRLNEKKKKTVSAINCTYANIQPKIVWKLETYIQATLYRTLDLIETINICWEKKFQVSCFILTRNILENTAQLYVLNKKIKSCLSTKDIDQINKIIEANLFSSRLEGEQYQATNIVTKVEKVDKEFNGFKHSFDLLCEYAHPNYYGMLGHYGNKDEENLAFNFSTLSEDNKNLLGRLFSAIDPTILVFEFIINQIEEKYEIIAPLCKDYRPIEN